MVQVFYFGVYELLVLIVNGKISLMRSYGYNAIKSYIRIYWSKYRLYWYKEDDLCMDDILLKKIFRTSMSDINYVFFISHLGYIGGRFIWKLKRICDFYNSLH